MNSNFYLFLPHQNNLSKLDSIELSWIYEDINSDLKLVQGQLKDAAAAALNHNVTIVIPGENVLFLTTEVPGKNLQHIQQAVPYVLEDSVINDVDELHFAISKLDDDKINNYNVAIIDKHYLESIILQLDKSGIHADAIIADYSLLKQKTLFVDSTRILFSSNELKFTSSVENEIQPDNYGLTQDRLDKIIYCNADIENKFDTFLSQLDVEKEACNIHPLLYLIKNKSSEININLLQGLYKKKRNWSKTSRTWLPAAALFLIWINLQGIVFVSDYIRLSNQNKAINIKITEIYKNTFPTSRRIDNPKARMESELISLKKRKGKSGRSFNEMLSNSAAIFSKTEGLKIKSLRYYDGRINLELNIASLQSLDKLKSQLVNDKGYQVEIQNASSGKENVTARIQITGAGS